MELGPVHYKKATVLITKYVSCYKIPQPLLQNASLLENEFFIALSRRFFYFCNTHRKLQWLT